MRYEDEWNADKYILDHCSSLHTLCRDYLKELDADMKSQLKTFLKKLDKMKDDYWISLATHEKATMIIENIISTKGRKRRGKKKM